MSSTPLNAEGTHFAADSYQLYGSLTPGAVLARMPSLAATDRGKYRVGEKVDDAAHIVRQEFRDNRLPIALAAVAGVAWLFREPIREHVPKLAQKVQDLAEAAMDKFRPDAAEQYLEEDDEAAE